jgi:hypothetical protein
VIGQGFIRPNLSQVRPQLIGGQLCKIIELGVNSDLGVDGPNEHEIGREPARWANCAQQRQIGTLEPALDGMTPGLQYEADVR